MKSVKSTLMTDIGAMFGFLAIVYYLVGLLVFVAFVVILAIQYIGNALISGTAEWNVRESRSVEDAAPQERRILD